MDKTELIYDETEKRYECEVTYGDFPDEGDGEYLIAIYAQDDEGNISEPLITKVCKGNCWDRPDDWDKDGVPDEKDAFPKNPDEQYDSDNDGIGDSKDQDDDNDDIPDIWEEFYRTNPIVAENPDDCDLPDYSNGTNPPGYALTGGVADSWKVKDSYMISGRVRNSDSWGIPDVLIEAEGTSDSAVTDDDGSYKIEVPSEWEGNLIASSDDYVFVPC